MGPHYLDHLFSPGSIAVFGASDRTDALGTIVFRNLLEGGYNGALYPINPKHHSVQGKRAYKHLSNIGQPIDLALVATPAKTVPDIVRQCGEHGIKAMIILSAGFSETGKEGEKLQNQIMEHAQHYGIRIIGPNCLGIMRPPRALNATFSHNIALPGRMALVSQSGAICTAVLDWAQSRQIGFSAMVSLGSASDIDFGDILSYLALDPYTHSILLYIEGIHDARSFMSSLRIAARMKPVVVVKSGRYLEGSRAVLSHTASIVGSDDVFFAALRRAGVVRAYSIQQLFSAAELLANQGNRVQGNRLAIVTNGGGPGVMATDHAVENNVVMADLGQDTLDLLNRHLPTHWSHGNPVDILGDASAERYEIAVKACLDDANVDAVLVMLTPQAMTQPTQVAETLIRLAVNSRKPMLTCWMGGDLVTAARRLFAENRIPHFTTPETSVEAFAFLASYQYNQQLLMQVPEPLGKRSEPDIEGARLIIEEALAEGRTLLNRPETMAVLKAFHIPAVMPVVASNANEALVIAEAVGFPIVMKIYSPDISHKSDVSGVHLNINSASVVRSTFNELITAVQKKKPDARIEGVTIEPMIHSPYGRELMIGIISDEVFGPAISIGSGGTMVEVMQDKYVSLPPLNRFIARNMISRTRINRALGAFRDMPEVNKYELENALLRVSEMVCELPELLEMDINPLIVDDKGVYAVDARMRVGYQSATARRYSHMAIHPYPGHLRTEWQQPDGSNVIIRPIRPEDANIEQAFIRKLSPQSKYFRFMQALHELTPAMLVRFTQIDYDLEMALIAVVEKNGEEMEIGVARYTTNPDGSSCEFAIVIADEWHHKGLGMHLMNQLMAIARSRDLDFMEGEVLSNNKPMLALTEKLGFHIEADASDPNMKYVSKRL